MYVPTSGETHYVSRKKLIRTYIRTTDKWFTVREIREWVMTNGLPPGQKRRITINCVRRHLYDLVRDEVIKQVKNSDKSNRFIRLDKTT